VDRGGPIGYLRRGVSSINGKFGGGVAIGVGIEKKPIVSLSLRLILLPWEMV